MTIWLLLHFGTRVLKVKIKFQYPVDGCVGQQCLVSTGWDPLDKGLTSSVWIGRRWDWKVCCNQNLQGHQCLEHMITIKIYWALTGCQNTVLRVLFVLPTQTLGGRCSCCSQSKVKRAYLECLKDLPCEQQSGLEPCYYLKLTHKCWAGKKQPGGLTSGLAAVVVFHSDQFSTAITLALASEGETVGRSTS